MGGGELRHQLSGPRQQTLTGTAGGGEFSRKKFRGIAWDPLPLGLGGQRLGKDLLPIVLGPVTESGQFSALTREPTPEALEGTDTD